MAMDPLDELMLRALARLRLMREEALRLLEAYMDESLFEERLQRLSSGVEEPLVEVHERDGEVVILVDVTGARPETVQVLVGEDRIEVHGEADERVVREAMGHWYMSRSTRRFHGVYRLPYRIDPRSVRVEKKGSIIVVRARRLG